MGPIQPKVPQAKCGAAALFLGAIACLYAVDFVCVAQAPLSSNAVAVTNIALPFDLMVFIPLVFYFLVVRRGGVTALAVLPAIALGTYASLLAADPRSLSLAQVLLPIVPLVEAVVGVLETRKAVAAYRRAKQESILPLAWFEAAFASLIPKKRVAHLPALECSIWWYLLRSWGKPAIVPHGARAFPYHRKSGYIAFVVSLSVLGCVETAVMHVLLSRVNVALAVVVTALTVYTLLWIAGSARAAVMNPLIVGSEHVVLQWGAHVSERVPFDAIARIGGEPAGMPKGKRLDLTPMGVEPLWIEFARPIVVHTLSGGEREILAAAVAPDERCAFVEAVSARLGIG